MTVVRLSVRLKLTFTVWILSPIPVFVLHVSPSAKLASIVLHVSPALCITHIITVLMLAKRFAETVIEQFLRRVTMETLTKMMDAHLLVLLNHLFFA